MSDTYLSKYDLKGNLITKFLIAADLGGLNDTPWGIETDGNIFAIVIDQTPSIGNSRIYLVNKKGAHVKVVNAPSSPAYGITTDRKNWIIADNGPQLLVADKKFATVSGVATTSTYIAMTHNGKNILAVPRGAATLHVLNPRDYAIAHTITMPFQLGGIANVHDRLAAVDAGGLALYYFDYSGNQIKGIAFGAPANEFYQDLCHDGEFLWILSYVIPDVDPPKDE